MPLSFAATPFGEIWCTGSGSPPLAFEVHPCCAGMREHPEATTGTSSGSPSAAANPTRADGALSATDTAWIPFTAAQELQKTTSKEHLAAEQPSGGRGAAPVVHSFPYNAHHSHQHLCHMGTATQNCLATGVFTGRDNLPSKQERGTRSGCRWGRIPEHDKQVFSTQQLHCCSPRSPRRCL